MWSKLITYNKVLHVQENVFIYIPIKYTLKSTNKIIFFCSTSLHLLCPYLWHNSFSLSILITPKAFGMTTGKSAEKFKGILQCSAALFSFPHRHWCIVPFACPLTWIQIAWYSISSANANHLEYANYKFV